jgi:hypothetical protein
VAVSLEVFSDLRLADPSSDEFTSRVLSVDFDLMLISFPMVGASLILRLPVRPFTAAGDRGLCRLAQAHHQSS